MRRVTRPPSRPPHPVLLVALAAALALVAAACGDDGDSSAPAGGDSDSSTPVDEYTAAFARSLSDDPGSPFSAEQSRCVAAAMVESVGGPSTFAELGVTVEDIEGGADRLLSSAGMEPTDEMANDFGTRFLACDISMGAIIAAGFGATGGGEVSTEFVSCVDDQLTAEALGEMFLAEDDAGEDLMVGIAMGCAALLDG